jgi:hypothetical protein
MARPRERSRDRPRPHRGGLSGLPSFSVCKDRVVADMLVDLAVDLCLDHRRGTSPDGLSERYLYSADMEYRYAFGRWWGHEDLANTVVWVLLNPATGDTERRRRPTLERCIAWSRADFSGLLIVNLFAYRATDPRVLVDVPDPVGVANDGALQLITADAPRTIVAWGSRGRMRGRSSEVARVLTTPMCLGTTKRGEPRHPLYVPSGTPLYPWTPASP